MLPIIMAVYTQVSHEDLTHFLSLYDIGTLQSHEGIEAGVSNTNYFVTTDHGRYVLTLFEPHRVRAEDIPFYLDYAIAMEGAGVPCPKTILRKDGGTLSHLNDRPAALFSVLNGKEGRVPALTAAMCRDGGKTLAQMHLAGMGIKDHAPNHFGPKRWDLWMGLLAARMDTIKLGLYGLTKAELFYLENNWPDDLPVGAIHGDYFADNVFFDGDVVTGVIDFHFACTDILAYDLAIAINAWCFDGGNEFSQNRYDAFMEGYQSVRALNDAEQKSFPLLLRAASLRFLLSRIEEKLGWKEGDFMTPHDPLVFEKRLKHFQGTPA